MHVVTKYSTLCSGLKICCLTNVLNQTGAKFSAVAARTFYSGAPSKYTFYKLNSIKAMSERNLKFETCRAMDLSCVVRLERRQLS
jgi:hypothetical protein